MKAVILAAGKSSRFYPFNILPHKSFFQLMGKPIIEYTILALKKAGLSEVIVVVAAGSTIPDSLGDGSALGVSIRYAFQKEANGQGDALLSAKEFLTESFFLLNAHRFDFAEFKDIMTGMQKSPQEVVLLGKRENILGKFGVAQLDGEFVTDIIEKPTSINPETDIRVLGIYLLNPNFLHVLENTPPEHYHLEKALGAYAQKQLVKIAVTDQDTFSLKYPWDLLSLKRHLLNSQEKYIASTAEIAESAHISGNVIIEDNVKILEGASIHGPCFIGRGSVIGNNALVRDYCVIEQGCTVGMNAEVKNAILGSHSSIHSGSLEDSVVGQSVKIGALFCSSNVRIDRTPVMVKTEKGIVNSGLRDLGVCIGDHTRVGVRVTTMPGILIGNNAVIGPSTTVMKNVMDNSKYYSTFREVVEKVHNHE